MAAISSLGVGSGLDLGSLVSSLLASERAPVENRLAQKEQTIASELSAFGLVRSSLAQFQSSLSGLQSADSFDAKSVSVSDTSIFTATADNDVELGSYSVEVSKLAKSQSLATSALTPFTTLDDVIGSGTLSFQFGTTSTGPYGFTADLSRTAQTIEVSVANGNNTLSGLRDYINTEITGIQASIVNDGSGYRLVLTSQSTGADNSLEITVTNDGDLDNDDNVGLSQLAFNALAQTSLTQTVTAQDAELSINGLDVTSASNTVSSVLDGITLNLNKADAGNIVSLSVTDSLNSITSSVNAFVQAFNDLRTNIDSLTAYNADTGTGSVLIGDFTVRSISSQLRNVVFGSVSGLNGEIRSLIDIGITTNASGTLDLDSSKLQSALQDYPDQVAELFGLQGTATDADVQFSTASDNTVAGSYAINVTSAATQGVLNGASGITNLTIDDDNDGLSLLVNGAASGNLSLTQGTYASAALLAAEIETQINNSSLSVSGTTVSVDYDSGNDRFVITADEYGENSTVEVTSIDLNTTADFGLSVAQGTAGIDFIGTIAGGVGAVSGNILTGQGGNSDGLSVEILSPGTTGARGTVSFTRGLAAQLDSLLNSFLGSDGFIATREEGLTNGLEEISEERIKLENRLASIEQRLVRQFSALDILVAQFNQTSSFLTQQLANLPQPNSGRSNN